MTHETPNWIARHLSSRRALAAAGLCMAVAACLMAGLPFPGAVSAKPAGIVVSQKDRAFLPSTLAIRTGETVTIVADDGTTVHHAYTDSDAFSFDSGDQDPGTRTPVVFGVPGTFTVMCGIHPRMKLTVQVD